MSSLRKTGLWNMTFAKFLSYNSIFLKKFWGQFWLAIKYASELTIFNNFAWSEYQKKNSCQVVFCKKVFLEISNIHRKTPKKCFSIKLFQLTLYVSACKIAIISLL